MPAWQVQSLRRIKGHGISDNWNGIGIFAVDAKKVTVLPEKMSYDEGAMIEPLAVAVHAVKRAGDVKGMKIAVLGAGPIRFWLHKLQRSGSRKCDDHRCQ